jgi:hypothetical protein
MNDSGRRLRLRWVVLVGAMLVVLLSAGVFLYQSYESDKETGRPPDLQSPTVTRSPTVMPSPSVVAEFSGEGNHTTDAFQVDGRWRIHWETTGERLRFAIVGDRDLGTVVRQRGPGSGTTVSVAVGSFQIEIRAQGAWSVQVTQEVTET